MTPARRTDATTPALWLPSYPVVVRPAPGGSPFCVPAALSALTGLTTLETTKLIQEEIGNKPISGVFYPIALKILSQLGFSYKEWPSLTSGGIYFLCFYGHVAVVDSTQCPSKFVDSLYLTGTNLGTPKRKSKIEKIFRVWKEEEENK